MPYFDDPQLLRNRELAAQSDPNTMTPAMQRLTENLKRDQDTFQAEHCKNCTAWSLWKNNFKKSGHPNNPLDCLWHWTDIVGVCWNYRPRKKPG